MFPPFFISIVSCTLLVRWLDEHSSIFGIIQSHRLQVGGGPTATSFLCFAKERMQRKATTLPLAFGFPIVQDKKWESLETRCAQTQGFLYPFSILHNWQCQKWMKVKSSVKINGNTKTISIYGHSFFN